MRSETKPGVRSERSEDPKKTFMKRAVWSIVLIGFLVLLGWAGVSGWRFYRQLEQEVVARFDGHSWQVASKIYAEPLLLYPGQKILARTLIEHLTRLGYHAAPGAVRVRGEYAYDAEQGHVQFFLREFPAVSQRGTARRIRIVLGEGTIERIVDLEADEAQLNAIDLDPEVITKLYGKVWEERRIVKLYDLPSLLVKALLAAEDHRFFEHHGIDLWRIVGASLANWREGDLVQGGSTLTQQLIKNFFLSPERTLGRKLLEICMALIVEHHYSKLEILENYLNEIYLGQRGPRGIFGVWEAARVYFGKEPRDLTLSEMALLAGIIKAPNRYNPSPHLDRALQRRNYVLRRMRELYPSEIPEEDYQAARSAEIVLRQATPGRNNRAPYFVDAVRKELEDEYPSEVLTTAGLHIFTSLDMRLQHIAQEAVRNGLAKLEEHYAHLRRKNPQERLQACLIALQPQTGRIRAMVGGRDYGLSQFNRVTQALRQPGSIFKPVVYLAALTSKGEQRYYPDTLIEDAPFLWEFGNQEWSPKNYTRRYRGQVSLRSALALSLNAATARLARGIGLDPIRETAWTIGFRSPLPLYPSLSLGAAEVSPFEVAVAFGTLANNGIRAAPRAITGIVNRDSEIVAHESLALTPAISPQDAYTITSMMETVLDWGTAWRTRQLGFTRPAAGKTGTTNDFGDAWFMGYTPDLLAVVWVGFDRRQALGLAGGQAALPIWTEFMKRALEGQPNLPFVRPAQDPLESVGRFVPASATTPLQPGLNFPVQSQERDIQAPIPTPAGLSASNRVNDP